MSTEALTANGLTKDRLLKKSYLSQSLNTAILMCLKSHNCACFKALC